MLKSNFKIQMEIWKELRQEIILISHYDNVETHGISTLRKVPEIKNSTEDKVMAIGEVIAERKIRYTFTDYIDNKKI